MSAFKKLGGTGFLLSLIVDVFLATLILGIYAVFMYPVSIILRAIAWHSLGKHEQNKFFKITGIAVLILGFMMYISLMGADIALSPLESAAIFVPLTLWIIYSLLEFRSYWILSRYNKGFNIARVSLIGLGITYLAVGLLPNLGSIVDFTSTLALLRVGFVILSISSAMATYGFFKYPST